MDSWVDAIGGYYFAREGGDSALLTPNGDCVNSPDGSTTFLGALLADQMANKKKFEWDKVRKGITDVSITRIDERKKRLRAMCRTVKC